MNLLPQAEILEPPVKSRNDTNEYRVIRLQNGLTACLISDAINEKMAAAALCVGVGSYSDPKNIQGLAHILEHVIGADTGEEIPNYNASTHYEVTNFNFECAKEDFRAELSKFASFFSNPFIEKSTLIKEREAIESEFQMRRASDEERLRGVIASLADADSPVSNFSCGNMDSLTSNVTDEEFYQAVMEFRKRHYSAHRMTLAVQAHMSLDELQTLVLQYFSDVTSNYLPPDDFEKYANAFDTAKFRKLYHVESINQTAKLQLAWALPSLLTKYESKPADYVNYVLSYKGSRSLLSLLKKKCWVTDLSVVNATHSFYAFLKVTMDLRNEGLHHLYEVIELFFSYLNMVKSVGPQEYLFNEMKMFAETAFKYTNQEAPVEFVERLSENMQFYKSKDYITGEIIYSQYDPSGIEEVLDFLRPDKMNITILCQNSMYDKIEKWCGSNYTGEEIPEQCIQAMKNATPLDDFFLSLPN